jgi:hypothetical protein
MLNPNFVYLGVAIAALGGISYLINTLKGTVQPNRVTWFLWALAPLIAFSAQIKQEVGIQSLLTFIVGFGPLLVFLATFVNKKSYWKISRLDMVFGGLSILGLILWQITGVGNIAILFSIIADAMAAVPTIIKSYHHPESESAFAYFASATGAFITLLTINKWNFATYAFSLYIFVVCSILTLLIKFKLGKRFSNNRF